MGVDIAQQSLNFLFQKKARAKYAGPFQETLSSFRDLLAEYSTVPSLDRGNYYILDFSAHWDVGTHSRYPEIRWEAKLGLVLCVRLNSWDMPIAAAGFERTSERILITQLQEVNERGEYLRQLHWRALLCRAVIVLTDALKLPEVCVHPICLSDVDALNSKLPERYQFHWDKRAGVYRCDIRA